MKEKINTSEYYYKMRDALIDYWEEMKAEFPDVDFSGTGFVIDRHGAVMKAFYNLIKGNNQKMRSTRNFVDHMFNMFLPEHTMTTQFLGFHQSGVVCQFVYLSTELLVEFMYMVGLENFDVCLRRMKICLRHEMGHCIDTNNYIIKAKGDIDKAYEMYMKDCKQQDAEYKAVDDEFKDVGFTREKCQKYHSTILESSANAAVGLTWEDIWNAEEEFYRIARAKRYKYKVKGLKYEQKTEKETVEEKV